MSLSRLATWGCVVPIILGTLVLIFVAYIWFYQRDAVFGALGMDDASSQAEKLAPGRSSAEPSLP